MRRLLLIAASLALTAGPTFAASNEEVSGLYDGEANCVGGAVQVMVWIDVDGDNGVTGSVKVTPLKGSSAKGGKVDIEGTFTGEVKLSLQATEGGKPVLEGELSEDEAGDMTLDGRLAEGGCNPFVLTLDPMSQM
jgi:hypothetical protein